MAAKKNIMREQRQEIQQLKEQISEQKRLIRVQQDQVEWLKDQHEIKMHQLKSSTKYVEELLRNHFTKELTWLELCDDPNSKFDAVKQAVSRLRALRG